MTREFILNTLLPYKQDPTTCAIDGTNCLYLTKDGKKCAVGKHLIDGEHQNIKSWVYVLNDKYDLNNILTKEAKKQEIPLKVWGIMQSYHDKIATEQSFHNFHIINDVVNKLEEETGFKFPELKF
jgi:hypothetical protein